MGYVPTKLPAFARCWTSGLAAACALAVTGCGFTEQPEDAPPDLHPNLALINLGPTLRVGWMGMDGHVGTGPGDDTGTPIYKVVQWNPHAEGLANVPAVIALADQKDILLLAYTPGPGTKFGLDVGAYDSVRYNDQLDKLDAIPEFRDAAARGRVQCYVGDEPHLSGWNGTWTPDLFNRAAGENKKRWPKCRTYGRVSPEFLWNGWDGHARPSQGYTYLDYGWLQYNATYRKAGQTIADAITEQRGFANTLNVGLALSMNMVNAGLRTNLGGVTACWNADRSSSTPNAVVIGNPAGAGYTEGQQVPCSQLPPTSQNLMVNPSLIKSIADVAKTDLDIPFLLYWSYPAASAGSDLLQDYVFRGDFVSAFDYAINQGATRTTFHGYRSPKPYP